MARKPPHPPWKPGQSGNPLGGKMHDPALKAIKNLTKAELVTIGNLIIKRDIKALKEVIDSKDATVLQVMLASVAEKIIRQGDMHALDILLNRLVGKVKDEIMHQGEINTPQIIVTLPDNGRSAKPQIEPTSVKQIEDDLDLGF
jgi:hypothetical protein